MGHEIVSEGADFERAFERLVDEVVARFEQDGSPEPLAIIGVRTGGAHLARRLRDRLAEKLDAPPALGLVDITLYRDDILTGRNPAPLLLGTEIDFDLEGRYVILVDDVLFTGRTVRAALDSLADLGRPRAVRLAVLVDRGLRELPIRADACGLSVDTAREEHVRVVLTESGADADCVIRERAPGGPE